MPVTVAALACVLALAFAVNAMAGTSAVTPTITGIAPVKLAIGKKLTIKGHGFRSGKLKNTVVFQRARTRPVFVRADSATSTRITITIPVKLLPFLATRGGQPIDTRFQLRVLSTRFGVAFTPRKLSPVISPPGTSGEGPSTPVPSCKPDLTPGSNKDTDGDGIADVREVQIKTDPCNADTDKDGIEDGFEYESALDLNSRALPYPGKRPYPNALDPSDAAIDYDGDGLTQSEEYALWVRYGGHRFPLSFSDGDQDTNPSGGSTPVPAGKAYLDLNSNGVLTDDEKDSDGDGLGNWDEIRGAFATVKNLNYSPLLDYLDPDTDGDTLPDGADDQDHDGFTNVAEIQVPSPPTGGFKVDGRQNHLTTNPMDPCDPDPQSRVCPLHGTGE
jgi:hypothetical protein